MYAADRCCACWAGCLSGEAPLGWRARDLPLSSVLRLTLFAAGVEPPPPCDADARVSGGASSVGALRHVAVAACELPLFSSSRRRLKAGRYALRLTRLPAELASAWRPVSGRASRALAAPSLPSDAAAFDAASRALRRFARGDHGASGAGWMDGLALPALEAAARRSGEKLLSAGAITLTFTLPVEDRPVLYGEESHIAGGGVVAAGGSTPAAAPPSSHASSASAVPPLGYPSSLSWLADPCAGRESFAARRCSKLARVATTAAESAALKPDAPQRRLLAAALRAPPGRAPPPAAQRELVWRLRYFLRDTNPAGALPCLLSAVDWADPADASSAASMLSSWPPPPGGAAAAVELLQPGVAWEGAAAVRAHALSILSASPTEQLTPLLLQLVQALRGDADDAGSGAGDGSSGDDAVPPPLPPPLVPSRAHASLSDLLVSRAAVAPSLAVPLYWYCEVEMSSAPGSRLALKAAALRAALATAMVASGADGVALAESLAAQAKLVGVVDALSKAVGAARGHARKADRLRALLADAAGPFACLAALDPPVPWPLRPGVRVTGVVPSGAGVFRSALAPLRLSFTVEQPQQQQQQQQPGGTGGGAAPAPPPPPPETVTLIYKKGDDLRQDQFCLQLVALCDALLRADGLDLRLTPYAALATGPDAGLVQFVPSTSVAAAVAQHRTILRFLADAAPDAGAPHGVRPPVFEAFLRSCAGYCAITYILGVGDRHLDNLMLCSDGRLFHIDFGFIFGRDPKLFPPPMKLCREMVEAMGGLEGAGYGRFATLACEAFLILRKAAPTLLAMTRLMGAAGIPDLSVEPERVVAKLEDKFALALDDEAAVAHFAALMTESASALFEGLKENAHRVAQFLR